MATGDVLRVDIRHAPCARPTLHDGTLSRYALGLEHLPMPGDETAWTHSGSWAGYRSDVVYLPIRDRSVAVLANRDDRWPWLLGPALARALATGEDATAVLAGY